MKKRTKDEIETHVLCSMIAEIPLSQLFVLRKRIAKFDFSNSTFLKTEKDKKIAREFHQKMNKQITKVYMNLTSYIYENY